MPKIAEVEYTPNPNARKFVLKEPLTWGIARSFDHAGAAEADPLASALFDVEHVTNVYYVDHWITVTQDGLAPWDELLRELARQHDVAVQDRPHFLADRIGGVLILDQHRIEVRKRAHRLQSCVCNQSVYDLALRPLPQRLQLSRVIHTR